MLVLNFGLERNDTGGSIAPDCIMAALIGRSCAPVCGGVHQSDTEPTAVFIVDHLNDAQAHRLCEMFAQDCIAVWDPSTNRGRLIGPKADAWGAFAPEYFILPTGERLAS